ncbi:MAG: DNA polymerase III subunit delta [Cyclobacteriaceae bacterium]|jgi:DNA polymerase-3 subunit delta'
MKFSDISGYEYLKAQLIQSVISDQIAHAQLFLGSEGGPNLALALAFSTYINCLNRTPEDSCGECDACRKNAKLVHPDVHFAFPVSATKKIKAKDVISVKFLSEWRNFVIQDPYNNAGGWNNYFGGENKQLNISRQESREIIKNLSLKPFEGLYKIMIIWLPEYMHPAGANALLKILEEPPRNTLFLLVSNDETKLLSTILSRTQIVHIRSFSDEEIKALLINQHFIEEDKAGQIAHLVDGNINEALRLAREVEDDSHKMFRDWMRLCYVGDLMELTKWTEKFNSMSKVAQQTLFHYGLSMMREALIVNSNELELSRLMGEELDFVKNFSKILSLESIEKISDILNEAFYHIERNAHSKILFLSVSLKIFEIFKKLRMLSKA